MNACMTRGASPRAPGTYVLPDVLGPGLAVVFCGTAAGAESARRGAYYAGPGNAFWHTLYHVGLTPRQLQPEEYRLVGQFGLGLTDLAKHAAGADAVLSIARQSTWHGRVKQDGKGSRGIRIMPPMIVAGKP